MVRRPTKWVIFNAICVGMLVVVASMLAIVTWILLMDLLFSFITGHISMLNY
jgi:uncharacterized membrane protein YukC